MENQEYSMYEIITMTPGMAGEVLDDEIKKKNPNMDLVKNILNHSIVEVNLQYSGGWTALMWASEYGRTEIVKLLLERPEIDVNWQTSSGQTALMKTTEIRNIKIVRSILNHPKINVNLRDSKGRTALWYACKKNNQYIIEALLAHPDIDVNISDENGVFPWGLTDDHIQWKFPQLKPKSVTFSNEQIKALLQEANEKNCSDLMRQFIIEQSKKLFEES